MSISSKSIQDGFWENYNIQDKDIEFLFNHLIEVEEPLSPNELLLALVSNIIQEEKKRIEKQQQSNGVIYLPNKQYKLNEPVVFPGLDWKVGTVKNIRAGINPDLPPFEVIEVELEDGLQKSFAAGYNDHPLNQSNNSLLDDPSINPEIVVESFGQILNPRLINALEHNKDLVRIAGKWFPCTLLVDVNIGYLNLAEALLDMADGGPLSTKQILEQIELPTDVNQKLTIFSLNHALQEDERFDEVGSTGHILWYLNKLEPSSVNAMPSYLKHEKKDIDYLSIEEMLKLFDNQVLDELENDEYLPQNCINPDEEIAINLIFPHWRSGTLPCCKSIKHVFPKAFESNRILFKFIDQDNQSEFNGWVVRDHNYIYGLEEYYSSNGLIPGSIVYLKKGKNEGEVLLRINKRKPGRDWIKTVSINSNGSISFTMLKQMVSSSYDERMAYFIPEINVLDDYWQGINKFKFSKDQAVLSTMLELAKLNPQGHVHAQELYAALNIIKRCPPGLVLDTLNRSDKVSYLGDLYFRINENKIQDEHE